METGQTVGIMNDGRCVVTLETGQMWELCFMQDVLHQCKQDRLWGLRIMEEVL
jgi:hypothetical protein